MTSSPIRTCATIYLSIAMLAGGFANWVARNEIKSDIQFINDPMAETIFRKYRKYNVRDFSDLDEN